MLAYVLATFQIVNMLICVYAKSLKQTFDGFANRLNMLNH